MADYKPEKSTDYKYLAFISYKREDVKWAKWLQRKLEHYKLPTSARTDHPDLPERVRPLFRDETDLSGGLLETAIKNALDASKYLIVICSPNAAKSPWVSKEVQAFIDSGREKYIIPFIIAGEPNSSDSSKECFPQNLRKLSGDRELLGININELGRDAAVVKVVARMFDLQFDTLWQRYEREQKRKRCVLIIGAILFAFLGISIGCYFVKQNRTIERQMNELFESKLAKDIYLMKAYLGQNRTEMALVEMTELDKNIQHLDSLKLCEYRELKQSLCDSILKSPMALIDIKPAVNMPSEKKNQSVCTENISIEEVVDNSDEDSPTLVNVYIKNKNDNATDTYYEISKSHLMFNMGQTHLALYVDGDSDDETDLDFEYSTTKAGIRVYSLVTGKIENFVSCWGWYSCMVYPMALSDNGKYLIYHEGWRSYERICFIDFNSYCRTAIQVSNANIYRGYDTAAISPNDKYFFLCDSDINEIKIYSTTSQQEIHTFQYEDLESVYWDDDSNICITSKGSLYIWNIKSYSNQIFHTDTFANGVTISNNNKYAAAACNNGQVYVWDIPSGKILFQQEFLAPEDVAFTMDEKSLWYISGWNEIKAIDIETKRTQQIYERYTPPHPWTSYLFMTKDGKMCISHCYYGNHYAIFDMKGALVEEGQFDESESPILSEFVMPEKFDFDPEFADVNIPELTTKRVSADGQFCIESYSTGIIKVTSIKEREILQSLILENR